jgi:hypothetical protein
LIPHLFEWPYKSCGVGVGISLYAGSNFLALA